MIERKYETEAKTFTDAIRKFADNPSAIDNIEGYLSIHFDAWIKKYAYNPETLASEMMQFAGIMY